MYCLHCKYTTKLRNDKEINALFASYKGGGQQSLLYQQSNRAPTLQFSHRIQKTSGARYSPTDCTDVHRLGGKTQPKNLCTSVKSVGGSSPPEASVYSVKSVGEYPPPEISVNSVNSVGGLAQANLEWVLWKEFGGRRGYGRNAIPSYENSHGLHGCAQIRRQNAT